MGIWPPLLKEIKYDKKKQKYIHQKEYVTLRVFLIKPEFVVTYFFQRGHGLAEI